MATTFSFLTFLVIGHVTTLPMTQEMDPDRYNHCYFVFLCFLVKPIRFPFGIYAEDPEMNPESSAQW
jgi:hypothetical protein